MGVKWSYIPIFLYSYIPIFFLYSYIPIFLYFLYLPKISYISSQNHVFFQNYEIKSWIFYLEWKFHINMTNRFLFLKSTYCEYILEKMLSISEVGPILALIDAPSPLEFSFTSYGKESLCKYCMNVDDGRIMRSWRSCLFTTL
jgi:hypothetical protein